MRNPISFPERFGNSGGRHGRIVRWLAIFLLSLWSFVSLPGAALAQAIDPCDPGNLIPNCRFDSFEGSPPRQVPSGWSPFIVSGDLSYLQDSDTYWGPPSLRMWSNGGTFTAGLSTQVGGLQPGSTYVASWGWGGPNKPDLFGRKLGIDPTGGTDPLSPAVIWGPLHYGPGRILSYAGPYSQDNPNVSVSAVARSSTITVFVWVEHPTSQGDDLIYLDNIGLRQDTSQPVAQPTATSAPPTATPVATQPVVKPVAPAATSTAAATPTQLPTQTSTPTSTPTVTPTSTATPSATPTHTPSPTATPSPTLTPTPLPTLEQRPTATPLPFYRLAEQESRRQPSLLLASGFGSLILALVAGLLLLVLRRLR